MEYKIVNSVTDLPEFDKELPILADIETGGLYTNLRMCQFLQPQTSETIYIVDIAPTGYNEDDYQHELQLLKDFITEHHTVWWNASYDLGTMNISPKRLDDLFYAVKSSYPQFQEFGLKKVVKKLRYTQGLYSSTEEDHGAKGYPKGSYISRSGYRYAAIDVLALSLMWNDAKIKHIIEHNMAYKVEGVFDAEAAKQNPDTYQTPKDTYYKLGEAGKKEAESAGVEDRTGMGSAVKLADSGKTVKASDAGATQSRPAGKAGTIKKVNNIQI